MKTLLVVAIVVVLAVGAMLLLRLGQVSSKEAHALVDKGAKLLDVRTASEFSQGHLPNAIHIPVSDLERRLSELGDKDQTFIVYCASGVRSARAKRFLIGAGYSKVHDLGGMSNW